MSTNNVAPTYTLSEGQSSAGHNISHAYMMQVVQ